MEEVSRGALVPAVKQESRTPTSTAAAAEADDSNPPSGGEVSELDKDWLCPICMQIIKDAFLTVCGHSFCYMCIITHLHNKSDCPCCGHYLTRDQLFPNFALDKLSKKTFVRQISKTASPMEHFRQALLQTGL